MKAATISRSLRRRRAAISEWNPLGLIAIRDTVWIKREEDLTDVRRANLLLAGPELEETRRRFLMEKATGCGVVIAVGPGEWQAGVLVKPEVQVGDRVIFGPFAGQDLKMPTGEHYFTIYAKDIRAIWPHAQAD